ncbi:MAG: tetratricopeptide repeat protein, partial [Methylocystis sp.]
MGPWSPIDNEEKRARWLFVGGGLAAVVVALWTFYTTYIKPPKSSTPSSGVSVTAQDRSVAFSGDVSGAINGPVSHSTINIGIAPEQLPKIVAAELQQKTEQYKREIAALSDRLQVNEAQIRAFFISLGQSNVAPEHYGEKMIELANQIKELRQQIAATPTSDDKRLIALKTEVEDAINAGDLSKADKLLTEIGDVQRAAHARLDAARAQMAVCVAATSAQRGEISLARLQYLEAAQRFAEAAKEIPPGCENERRRTAYLEKEAMALYRQGDEFGDNASLSAAADRLKTILALLPRDRATLAGARTQRNLGVVLETLGERERGTGTLRKAVAALSAAIEGYTRERVPLEWAITQNNLGNALLKLGERERGTAALQEAVAAFHAAIEEFSREREHFSLDWAMAQDNLGNALSTLGERERGTAMLHEAVTAHLAALEAYTRELTPLEWATSKNNLGVALSALGEREHGTAMLHEAEEAFRAALEVWTQKRVPLRWAAAQNNLGDVLLKLGKWESGT